jgi:TonB family protein
MNAAVAQERWRGQVVAGKYELGEWLGGSANSAVFRTQIAGQTELPAAIKLIPADGGNGAQRIARWKQLSTLSHSNLLRIYDAGYCQITGAPWLYVVVEYADENLDQVLPVRALTVTEVNELLPPALEALSYLHAKHMVHGRIKPSNIFAVKNQLKLAIDTVQPEGLREENCPLTACDPPEAESGPLTAASDMWSLGMTIVTAFNQRPLTWSRTSQLNPAVPKSVPPPYALIASQSLRVNPSERCSLMWVQQYLRQSAPPPVTPPPSKRDRRNLIPVAAAVVLFASVAGVTVHYAAAHRPSRTDVQQAQSHSTDAAGPSGTASMQDLSKANKKTDNESSATSSKASVVEQILPPVPLSARETIQGKVRVKVRVTVDGQGQVSAASLESPGPSRYFARLALEASRKWKFRPPIADGQPADTQWLLAYRFGRSSTEVTPVQVR